MLSTRCSSSLLERDEGRDEERESKSLHFQIYKKRFVVFASCGEQVVWNRTSTPSANPHSFHARARAQSKLGSNNTSFHGATMSPSKIKGTRLEGGEALL